MSLIPQDKLDTEYWQHTCPAKDGSVVYNQKGQPCPFCAATEPAPAPAKKKK